MGRPALVAPVADALASSRACSFLLLALSVALVAATIGIQASTPTGQHVEAAVWMLPALPLIWSVAFTPLCCPPYSVRRRVAGFVGVLSIVCSLIAAFSFAAGAASPYADRSAMGAALFVALLVAFVAILFTVAACVPSARALEAAENAAQITTSSALAGTSGAGAGAGTDPDKTAGAPLSRTGRIRRAKTWEHVEREQIACFPCHAFCWTLFAAFLILFTYQAALYPRDLASQAPPSTDLIRLGSPFVAMPTTHTAVSSFPLTKDDFPDPDDGVLRNVHWVCNGTGKPLVILAHGNGGTLWDWSWTQRLLTDPSNPNATRVCAFSRLGYGYSNRGPGSLHMGRAAAQFKRMLETANISEPFVLAGHSLGGLFMRTVYGAYGSNITGLVYVDAMNPRCFTPCTRGGRVRLGADYGPFFATLVSTGIPRALADTDQLPMNGTQYKRILPPDVGIVRQSTFISTSFWQTYSGERYEFSTSCAIAKDVSVSNLSIPVTSISGELGIHANDFTCGTELAQLSAVRPKWVLVKDAPHVELLFDLKFARSVAAEIGEVVAWVRGVR